MRFLFQMTQFLLEKGVLPDPVIRFGIRGLLKDKLKEEKKLFSLNGESQKQKIIDELKQSPIAVNTQEANEQHYEVPTEFFQLVMGDYMKYSCCYWNEGVDDLTDAEKKMLEIYIERAELKDGQDVLELGCGWGSMSLFMAKTFPNSNITGVSNSATQKKYIDSKVEELGLKNLTIITCDMNQFQIDKTFDRVVSIEMFEHMRNYQKLFSKVHSFLKDDGKLFVHVFTHKDFAYLYEAKDENDWIGKYFFTGGVMPSNDLFLHFDDYLTLDEMWKVNGRHYEKTSNAWLENMDENRDKIIPILKKTYGNEYRKWWNYWRIFFMSCAELWGYDKGREWMVCHYRFKKQ